jgi:putative ABC transport system permease protein
VLESGGAVSSQRGYVADGQITLDWWLPEQLTYGVPPVEQEDPAATDSLATVVMEPQISLQPTVVISPETAQRLGMQTVPGNVVVSFTTPPTQAELDAANAALESLETSIAIEEGPPNSARLLILGALGLCAILFLGASAVAIGLARADGRQDDATLAAVGATRMLRRTISFWQAIIIVGIGAVAGTAFGLLMSYAFSIVDASGSVLFVPPWLEIGALVIGMPLLIAIGSWLVASRPSTLARRAAIR